MTDGKSSIIEYSVWDPTGNITALVETDVEQENRTAAATELMRLEPSVEQVGFVSFKGDNTCDVKLRMAGGEFCGNATMCSASMYAAEKNTGIGERSNVRVSVSGAKNPLLVKLCRKSDAGFEAETEFPEALSTEMLPFGFEDLREDLPLVRMQGIDHMIIEEGRSFFGLKDDPDKAERVLKLWCEAIYSDCLGLMFLEGSGERYALTPLVYVPGAQTMFWENSCASGSVAAGMYLSAKEGKQIDVRLSEPGGTLGVKSDMKAGKTTLFSGARRSGRGSFKIDTELI